jgi:parallel beta-helix repeat protein
VYDEERIECRMKLEPFLAIITVACLLSTILLPSVVTHAQADSSTIYVDIGNANNPKQDGSAYHPFDSIQKGIGAAGTGDTVQVAAGVYYEEVDINKSSISLVGQKGSTILDGNRTGAVGIRVYHVSPDYTENVSISGFTVRNFVKGITLSRSIYIRLRDDNMINNTYDFGDYTLQVHDIDTSNTVDGKPIYFWVNQQDKQIPADAGFVDLVNCANMTVKNLNLTNNVQGLVLKNTTNSLVKNVRIMNNWDGLYLQRWSNSNTLIDNTVSNNLFMGIYVSTSSSNIIKNNSITNNGYGLFLDSTVFEYVIGYQPTDNTVTGNIVTGNTVANSSTAGVYSDESEDNLFYFNNFVNNNQQVYSVNSTNVWDNDVGGNYWTDYAGKDLNKTGFGDVPYVVDKNNRDNHPLIGLFSDFPVTWQEETYHITAICNCTESGFYFSQPEKAVGFSLSGSADDGSGFCMLGVPVSLLGGPYTLVMDGLRSTSLLERSNRTHSSLYFAFDGTYHDVRIEGTSVVSEFPSFSLVFFLAVATVGVVFVTLRRRFEPALSG